MDNIEIPDFVKNNPVVNNKKYLKIGIIAVVSVIVIYILIMLYKEHKYKLANPTFLEKGHLGTKSKIISGKKIPSAMGGVEMSTFCWLYIDNITYNYGKTKHIFTKGNISKNSRNHCPSVHMDPKTNDILISISNKNYNDDIRLKDIPLKKWFSLAIVIRDLMVNVYLDGELYISQTMRSIPKINNGNLYVSRNGGFKGVISNLGMFSIPLDIPKIKSIHKKGPNKETILKKAYNKIKSMAGYGKPSPLDIIISKADKK